MKQLLFGIFAHPDDEAFGPGIFLHEQAHSGTDVHLVVATDGESGINNGYADLAATRLEEWLESGRRIGATSNLALHYADGGLCNNVYLEIAKKISEHITATIASYDEPVELNFITFEDHGVTGHLDHIAMSFITTYIFECIKKRPPKQATMGVLRYYCLSKDMKPDCDCDWIYMPCGRDATEIGETLQYEGKTELRKHLMSAHVSQKHDMDYILSQGGGQEACSECFIVRR